MGNEILSRDFVLSELAFWNVPGLSIAVDGAGRRSLRRGTASGMWRGTFR